MFVPILPAVSLSLTRRRLIAFALVVSLPVAAGVSAGRLIVKLDPLERADAIYVLAGTRATRLVEAQRLYQEGYAPEILLSPGDLEYAEKLLLGQGIPIATDADRGRALLIRLGVPPDAILLVGTLVDNTAQEVDAITPLVDSRGWRTIIVIGDRPSSRRVGFAFRRVFGDRLKIIVTANRDDPYDPARWWRARWSARSTLYEVPKLLAYWLGLRG